MSNAGEVLDLSVLSHHAGRLNIQGQIYLMPDCMKGLVHTVTLHNTLSMLNILREFFVETRMPNWICIFKNRMDN